MFVCLLFLHCCLFSVTLTPLHALCPCSLSFSFVRGHIRLHSHAHPLLPPSQARASSLFRLLFPLPTSSPHARSESWSDACALGSTVQTKPTFNLQARFKPEATLWSPLSFPSFFFFFFVFVAFLIHHPPFAHCTVLLSPHSKRLGKEHWRKPITAPTSTSTIMNPAAASARAKSRAVLDAQVCHDYFDLLSWASEPLKQRVHFLRSKDGANLKELLGLWDPQQSRHPGPSDTSPTIEQIDEFLHLCKSGSSDSSIFPVYQRQVETDLQQALVFLGRITPKEYLSVALVAEGALDKQDPNWKYHGLALSQEHRLVAEGWRVMPETTTVMSPPICPLPLHGYPFGSSLIYGKEQEQAGDDDDDDDYWQQYGEPEAASPSVTEPSSAPPGFRTTTHSSIEPEVDAEEEEYWRKYAEHQEEQPLQPSSTSKDSDRQSEDDDGDVIDSAYETYNSMSPLSSGSTETRRILVAASLDTRVEVANHSTEIAAPNNKQLDDGLACSVDPTTLTMLLKQLAGTTTTVGQETCRSHFYQDDDDDNNMDRAAVEYFVGEHNVTEKSPEEFRPRTKDDSNNIANTCSLSVSSGTQSLSTSRSQNQEPMRPYQPSQDSNVKDMLFPCQQSEPLHSPPTASTDDPASCSWSVISTRGVGSPVHDKSGESLISLERTTPNNIININSNPTTTTITTTTLASITPVDSPSSRSSPCVTKLEHPSECDSHSENQRPLCSDRIRILCALKALVSEASSSGLDQQDLLAMLEECFSLK